MKLFRDLTEQEDEIAEFKKKQFDDDENIKRYLENCSHKEFNFAILHLGVFLDTVATYTTFMGEYLEKIIRSNGNKDKKLNKFLRDLNKKINNEYGFSDDILLVEEGVLFDNELYLFINKSHFMKIMEISNL